MFKDSKAFSGFSVDDIAKAKQFYGETLELDITDKMNGLLLHIAGSSPIFVYPKPNHESATFTILNFPVDDIDRAVDELTAKGVQFEHYDSEYLKTDTKGIARSEDPAESPHIAWFKDPAGNILAVLQEKF